MIDTFAETAKQELKKDRDAIEEALLSGRVASFDEYRFHCGQRRGLTTAIQTIEELQRAAREE